MNNINKDFWKNFYDNKDNIEKIKENSSFSSFVYEKYISEYNKKDIRLKIADIGSGNCRDSIFFSGHGNLCYAVDINNTTKEEYLNCYKIKDDVEDFLKEKKSKTLFDMIYMRWFMHALPYDKSKNIFNCSVENIKPGGLICIEVRSLNDVELKQISKYDPNDSSYESTHKRWLYTNDMCIKLADDNDCDVLYCDEDYFSPNVNTETENPLLIRFICRKKLLPYYERSENYNSYKEVVSLFNKESIDSYDQMNKFNIILEKHNIKYVAVAGTILGLNRHGGIIPWDNDIDIGFIDSEWKKLMLIKEELNENGFKYKECYSLHCHFGLIDCFCLSLKNNSYDGDARTYCSINEYKNVAKQIFGYTYIYAPFCSRESLTRRYGNYFMEGDVNDNFHYKNSEIKRFKLNKYDLSYQLK